MPDTASSVSQNSGSYWHWCYESEPREQPELNMALDAAILDAVSAGAQPTVRVYRWAKPTITVGRLQDFNDVRRIFPHGLLVRRPTGGKAVVHGEDLTITVVAQEQEILKNATRRGVLASYGVIVGAITDALRRHDVLCETGSATNRHATPDCFANTAQCDLREELTGKKLLGSAQLRRKGIILQQMSLRSSVGFDATDNRFIRTVKEAMRVSFNVAEWQCQPLSPEVELAARADLRHWELER